MSDDQDTMDEWAAALAEAEGTDDSGQAKVTELDELSDTRHEISGEEKRKLDIYFRYTCDYFYGSRAL